MMGRAAAIIALALFPIAAWAAEVRRAQYLMGTVCEVAIDGDARQIDAAFAEAARVERLLSTWREDSELSALNRGEANAASPELQALLDRVIKWRDRTGGAFEPRIRPLIDAWRTREQGSVPSSDAIAAALDTIRSGRAAFEEGGFGKGYAIDRMLARMEAPSVVINFGGQIAVRGEWRVSIADPERRDVGLVDVTLRNASLSTSSGSEKQFNVRGRRFTHIIDPRTGQALPPRGSVSVIAADAFSADVLSTALYVMGADEGLQWANANRVAALFITPERQIVRSETFPEDRKMEELQRQIDVLTQEIEKLKSASGESNRGPRPEARGPSFGGYGEMLYENHDHAQADRADLLRAVLYTDYKFTSGVLFNSELEVEHASTEGGGAVSMEFAYLDFLHKPWLNYRAGVVLVPVGLINEQHEPTAFLGARRPLVEQIIIPATWGEIGAGVFGDVRNVSYRAYLVTGLNSAHFGSDEGIRGGRQAGAEALAEDFAVVGRADWHPFEGALIGGSLYSGNSGQTANFAGRVTLGEVHGDAKFRGVSLRALYARGTIGNAASINDANGLTGDASIGKTFGGWYADAGYDIAPLFGKSWSLTPYVRYEQLDTQRSVPAGFIRNLANDQSVFTAGMALKPISQTVIKIDYQNVSNKAHIGASQWNVAVGYIF